MNGMCGIEKSPERAPYKNNDGCSPSLQRCIIGLYPMIRWVEPFVAWVQPFVKEMYYSASPYDKITPFQG